MCQGDLGAIDEKYDVAVSTACPALDHIVVDTINTAQQCVEHLKQHGVGVATFIGLDKMERWKTVCRKPLTASVFLHLYTAILLLLLLQWGGLPCLSSAL